jgi:catalase
MLSYSDTQRYRLGTNYLQLPINAPKKHVSTNLRDGQMAFYADTAPGQNRHVNYEPSMLGGLSESPLTAKDHTPRLEGKLVREKINPCDDFQQAGVRYRSFEGWEHDELMRNLVNALVLCDRRIQTKMIDHFTKADLDYGRRVADGLKAPNEERTEETGQPIGAHEAHPAVKQAESKGHPARPY